MADQSNRHSTPSSQALDGSQGMLTAKNENVSGQTAQDQQQSQQLDEPQKAAEIQEHQSDADESQVQLEDVVEEYADACYACYSYRQD